MSPLEFMQRLAARVPRPRWPRIRFHGVLALNAKLRPKIIPDAPVSANDPSVGHADAPLPAAPTRISWARLLKRVFDIDSEQCPHGGDPLTIIAAIEHPPVIAKILAHLGLPIRAPPRSLERPFDRLPMAGSPIDSRFDPVHLPEPTLPPDLHAREAPKRPKTWRLGPMNGPKIPRFQLEDSRA